MKQLQVMLMRIPFIPLAFVLCGYFAYDYWDFEHSAESPLGMKRTQLAGMKTTLEISKKKLANAEDFFKNLDVIRTRIRNLSQQLENTKTNLNAEVDLANFVRMITLEAKKVGLTIKSIRPAGESKKEYYIEVPFAVTFHGAYIQILVFFDRIVRLQQVIRVNNFDMRPAGNVYAKHVELDGQGQLITYKYLGSSADDVTKQEWMKNNDEGLKKIQDLENKHKEGKK